MAYSLNNLTKTSVRIQFFGHDLKKNCAAPHQPEHQNNRDVYQSQTATTNVCGEQVTWQDVISWVVQRQFSCHATRWVIIIQVSIVSTCLVILFVSTVRLILEKRQRKVVNKDFVLFLVVIFRSTNNYFVKMHTILVRLYNVIYKWPVFVWFYKWLNCYSSTVHLNILKVEAWKYSSSIVV